MSVQRAGVSPGRGRRKAELADASIITEVDQHAAGSDIPLAPDAFAPPPWPPVAHVAPLAVAPGRHPVLEAPGEAHGKQGSD